MRKLFAIICAAVIMMVAGYSANAQCAFPEGTVGINLGFGVGNSMAHHHGNTNHYSDKITIPSFNFALDYGFLPNVINSNSCISGGGYLSMGHGSDKVFNLKDMVGQWKAGTRGALHYTWVRNLDTYAGVGLGVKHESYRCKDTDTDTKSPKSTSTDFDGFGFGGVRYIMGNFAVYSEISTCNQAWFQLGLSIVL